MLAAANKAGGFKPKDGLFEGYVLLPLGMALLHGEENPAVRIEELKRAGRDHVNRLPLSIFPDTSKRALKALLSDMPKPRGTLTIHMTAEPGMGAARMMPLAISRRGIEDLDDVWSLMDGVTYDITYDRR